MTVEKSDFLGKTADKYLPPVEKPGEFSTSFPQFPQVIICGLMNKRNNPILFPL
jgi:hypothetical protein